MILPISTIKCKQWFYQYQQLNVNSDSTSDISAITKCKQWSLPISIKCKQWFYQYQQLNVNSDYQYQIKCKW